MALPGHAQEPGSPAPFGKYELLELQGRGGMAEVFLARAKGPLGFERILVIKRILAHLSEDDDFREMFVAEAKLSAALAHGNVVQVYEFGEVDGQLFLAMEYVPGTDLRSVLKKVALEGVGIPPGVAAHVAIEVLAGLGHAHAKADLSGKPLEIVHRDVSPSNVLLSPQGEVKICDFGIAKMAARHTSTGRLKGKFAYMSPEQAAGEAVDARSDLFGVGIVLWESLTGKRLFKGDSDVSTLGMVRAAEVPELPDVGAPCQDRLRRILRRALEKKPARRYSSAEIFAADLREWLGMARVREPASALRDLVRQVLAGEDASKPKPVVTETTPDRSGVVDAAQTAVTPRPEMDERPRPLGPPPPPAPLSGGRSPATARQRAGSSAPEVPHARRAWLAPPDPAGAPGAGDPASAPGGAPGSAPEPAWDPAIVSPAPGLSFADSSEVSPASLELVGRRRRPGLIFIVGGLALVVLTAVAMLLLRSGSSPEPTGAPPALHLPAAQEPPRRTPGSSQEAAADGVPPTGAVIAGSAPSPALVPAPQPGPPAAANGVPPPGAVIAGPAPSPALAPAPRPWPPAAPTATQPAAPVPAPEPAATAPSAALSGPGEVASPPVAPRSGTKAPARPRPRASTVNSTVDPFSNLSGGSP